MSRRTVLVPVVALLLGVPAAAVVPGAVAQPLPNAACADDRPGNTPKGCPAPPEEPVQEQDGSGTCYDVVGGEGRYEQLVAGSLTALALQLGTSGTCVDATYRLTLYDTSSGAVLAEQARTGGAVAVTFAVPVAGYSQLCVAAAVEVDRNGVLQDRAPDSGTISLCDGGSPAQNWN